MRTKNIFFALALMVAAMLLSAPVASAQNLTPKVNPKSCLYGYWGTKKNGNEAFIIKPKFDKAEKFVNGHAFVSVNGAWYVIGIDGKALSSTTYSKAFVLGYDHYRVCQGDKYGVVDLYNLATILPIKYDAINTFDGKYKLTIDGKLGLADKVGKEILPIKYDAIDTFDGKYKLTIDGKLGLADKVGKEILPIKYDAIDNFDDKYKLTIDGKQGLADKSGSEILPIKYDAISALGNAYKVAIGNKYGVVDGENKDIISIKYDAISTLGNAYEVAIGDKWGIVDKTNKVIVEPQYKAIKSVDGVLYALLSDKWIFVDSSGDVVDISDRVMHYTTNNGQKLTKYPSCQNLFCDGVGVLVFTNVIEPEQWINFLMGFDNVNRINGKEIISDSSFKILGDKLVWVDKGASSVSIPATVKSIAPNAFVGCKNIENVNVADLNLWLRSGVDMSSSDGWSLYHNGKLVTNVTIPNGVTEIARGQFCDNKSLTSITIPNSVTKIGESAFEGCSSLVSITIPASVKEIGESAFYNCSSLYSVTIGNGVTKIGNSAFEYCRSLGSITIPASVTYIGSDAFWRDEEWGTFYIYMKGATPPALGGTFTCGSYNYDRNKYHWWVDVITYVPESALFNYRSADVWKEMADKIKPMD